MRHHRRSRRRQSTWPAVARTPRSLRLRVSGWGRVSTAALLCPLLLPKARSRAASRGATETPDPTRAVWRQRQRQTGFVPREHESCIATATRAPRFPALNPHFAVPAGVHLRSRSDDKSHGLRERRAMHLSHPGPYCCPQPHTRTRTPARAPGSGESAASFSNLLVVRFARVSRCESAGKKRGDSAGLDRTGVGGAVCVCVCARARIVAQKVVAQENKFYNHSLCVRWCACECVCVCPTN